MNQRQVDVGTLTVLFEQFEEVRYPRGLAIKRRLDAGETLDDRDIAHLERVIVEAKDALEVLSRNPDYQELATKVISFTLILVDEALDNEQHKER